MSGWMPPAVGAGTVGKGRGAAAVAARFLRHRLVQVGLRLAVGGVFLYAGVMKMGDPVNFAREIANYRILPDVLVRPLAVLLPGVEVASGLAVMTGVLGVGGAAVISLLSLVFMGAIASVIARGIDIACGCFGAGSETTMVGWGTLGRDAALLAASLAVLWAAATDRGRGLTPPGPPRGPGQAGPP